MWSNKGKINLCRKCTQTNTFKAKLRLFSRQQSFTHCPIFATLKEAPQHAKKYRKPLDGPAIGSLLLEKFDKALQLVSCPFSQYPETPLQKLQLEHIKLQCDSVLKVKFSSLKLDESFLFFFFKRILVVFGSTYASEQMLSVMSCNKAHHRSQFTDEHCRSVLRIATTKLTPDCGALAKKGNQQRCSHWNGI